MRMIAILFLGIVAIANPARSDEDEDRGLANDISRSIEIRNSLGASDDSPEESMTDRIIEDGRQEPSALSHESCSDIHGAGKKSYLCYVK